MATGHIEKRVAALEAEILRLRKRLNGDRASERPWWQEIAGGFANDPAFEQAMQLGEQYRRNLRPKVGRAGRKPDAGSRHRSS